MSNSYTIPNTDGTNQITITAGAVNGNVTGSVGTDTDLILYGRGSFNWGQGIEQNLIRLTENWASPSEVTGASVNTQVPKSYAGTPNKGITSPIVGQNWFNKSNNRPYVYTATGWQNDAAKHGVQLNPAGQGAQVVNSDLKAAGSSPDIYIHSTAAGYIQNSHLVFESTTVGGLTTITGSLHSNVSAAFEDGGDAIFLRKFPTREYDVNRESTGFHSAPLLESANSLSGSTNQMKMTDFSTIFNHPLEISGNSTGGYVSDANVPGLDQNTLTTKRVVEELIELNTNAQPDYVPMTGTRPFDAFNTTTLASYMTGNLGIQARIGTSGPNSDARLIMGFTGTTTQDTGFVTLESHNPRFLANTKRSDLGAEPMYALGIEGTMKARMFVKRGHWEATKFADADPELHNPDNLKEWFAAPINQGDPAENKYGIKNDQDTLGILKYNRFTNPNDAIIANGFIIFDKWIETVKDTGMIRTTSPSFTYSGDDPDYDRTLATIQSVKGYVASAITGGTGNFYIKGDNLTIDTETDVELKLDAADTSTLFMEAGSSATLIIKGEDDSKIQLRTTSGSSEYGEISFYASISTAAPQSIRGRIAVESGSNNDEDTLVLQKWKDTGVGTGSVLQNSLEVRYDSTYSTKKLIINDPIANAIAGDPGQIQIYAGSNGLLNYDPWASPEENVSGLLFKNDLGNITCAITSDNSSGGIRLFGKNGTNQLWIGELTSSFSRSVFLSGSALRPSTSQMPITNALTTEEQVINRTFKTPLVNSSGIYVLAHQTGTGEGTGNAAGPYMWHNNDGDFHDPDQDERGSLTSSTAGQGAFPYESFDYSDVGLDHWIHQYSSHTPQWKILMVIAIPYIMVGASSEGVYDSVPITIETCIRATIPSTATVWTETVIGNILNHRGVGSSGHLTFECIVPYDPSGTSNVLYVRLPNFFGPVNGGGALETGSKRVMVGPISMRTTTY